MQGFGNRIGRRGGRGGAVLAATVCLLLGPVFAQTAAPVLLSAADLPELVLAPGDGLRIGRAALPEAAPQLPPARTAARVAGRVLPPLAPVLVALRAVPPAALPDSTALALAPLAPVPAALLPRAAPERVVPVALAAPLPQVRTAARAAAPVPPARLAPAPPPGRLAVAPPPARLTPVVPAALVPHWLDPEDPEDRAALQGIFGPVLPPDVDGGLPPIEPVDPKALALAVQAELQRLNCYRGTLDGDWGRGSQSALAAYGEAVGTPPETLDPTSALLQDLKVRPEGKVCPDPPVQKPAAPAAAAAPAPKQPTSKPANKQQAKPPAQKQQPAKPAKKQPDIAIIGL